METTDFGPAPIKKNRWWWSQPGLSSTFWTDRQKAKVLDGNTEGWYSVPSQPGSSKATEIGTGSFVMFAPSRPRKHEHQILLEPSRASAALPARWGTS
jgi:hypothetical protein